MSKYIIAFQDIAQQKADCRKRLEQLPEPASGEPDVIQIRIKLPNGAAYCRRFSATDQFQVNIAQATQKVCIHI